MNKSFVIKTAVAIVYVIGVAVSASLDIQGIINVPVNLWIVIFIVFCVVVAWMMYGLYKENSRLRDNRPTICVEPVKDGESFYLKVSNKGEKGILKAQIELESEDDPRVWGLKNYIGYWKHAKSDKAEILGGHTDWIKIAELVTSQGLASEYLEIFFYGNSANPQYSMPSSSHWIGATIESKKGEREPMTKHEYKIQVTISADPSLREGVYKEKFRFDVDRIEIDNRFG